MFNSLSFNNVFFIFNNCACVNFNPVYWKIKFRKTNRKKLINLVPLPLTLSVITIIVKTCMFPKIRPLLSLTE